MSARKIILVVVVVAVVVIAIVGYFYSLQNNAH